MIWAILILILIGFIVAMSAIRVSGELTKMEEMEDSWQRKIE